MTREPFSTTAFDVPLAAHYVGLQAALWRSAAHQHLRRGDPPEIAENALLAAVVAFGEVGQFAKVGALYGELQALELPTTRRGRRSSSSTLERCAITSMRCRVAAIKRQKVPRSTS